MTNELQHYGVKGMRWGVRRPMAQPQSLSRRSEDHIRARELKKKPISSMSNAELRFLNERLGLEQTTKRLNPSKVKTGRESAREIIATVGVISTVVGLAKSPLGKTAIDLGKKVVWGDRFNNLANFPSQ